MLNNEENSEEGGGLQPVRKVTADAIHIKRSHHLHGVRVLRTLDIPSGHP